ncbi:MAG TPA: MliC family protein [Bradyrhizobium sp.]|nr:MliC family protein [Bradyrhizobium sp.]
MQTVATMIQIIAALCFAFAGAGSVIPVLVEIAPARKAAGALPRLAMRIMSNKAARKYSFVMRLSTRDMAGAAAAPVRLWEGKSAMRLILTFFALVGTANSAFAAQAAYRCTDGTAVRAVFSAPGPTGSVRLTFAGNKRSATLPLSPSADGGRYADGGMEFWIKGKTARLTRAGAETECKTQ